MLWRKILTLDVNITSALRIHEDQKWMRPIGTFFAHSGDSWFILLVLAFLWFFTSGEWRKLTILVGIAVIILALLVLSIKFLIKRQRPEGTWGAIYRNSDPHSFPSGHAARTMMLGTLVLLLGYPWIGVIMLVWAILVSLARVGMGVHYFSDIFAGIILGGSFAFGFVALVPWILTLVPAIFLN
jgi:undecaprenyl-diphosphatase